MTKFHCILLIFLLTAVFACDSSERAVQKGDVVNIYSNVLSAQDRTLFTAFERSSGVKVNIISDQGERIIERLIQQQQDSILADIILLEGITFLQQAKVANLLDTLSEGSIVNVIPKHLRDLNLQWIGLGYSANGIAYLRDSIDTLEVKQYADLNKTEWKGKVGWGTKNKNIYYSQLASMLADQGIDASQWIFELTQNLADTSRSSSPTNFSISDSSAWLAVLNSAEYIKYLSGENSFQSSRLLFPKSGTYLHLTGVGIAKEAPHPAQAQALLHYLFSRDIMMQYTKAHFLYPSRPDIEVPVSLRNLGSFSADTMSQTNIARFSDEARALFERYSW